MRKNKKKSHLESLKPLLLEDAVGQGFGDGADPGLGIVLAVEFLLEIPEGGFLGRPRN